MDDMDMAFKALEIQIKKEIIDNYFAERRYLEEESQALDEAAAAYREEYHRLSWDFAALYAALEHEEAIRQVVKAIGLPEPPFLTEFRKLPPEARKRLLNAYPRRGFTAWRRYLHLALDIYRRLVEKSLSLKEQYDKVTVHLRLLNEDIVKFNSSFDFGLIAAQMEAMGGGGEPISGGLLSGEREELSTRMRFKRCHFTEAELPPPPDLPSLDRMKEQLKQVLSQFGP